MGLRAKFGGGGKCLPGGQGFAAPRVSHPRGAQAQGFAALRAPRPFPLAAGALANNLKLLALRPLGFLRTSPYRSKLLTALHEKSPVLRTELQIVCGKTGIRTLEPLWAVTRFPDVPLQPLEHLSKRICKLSIFRKISKNYFSFIIRWIMNVYSKSFNSG